MIKKIKVALIYKKNNIFLSGKHYDNTYYHFFVSALNRNSEITVTHFRTDDVFDTNVLKNNFDIVLLYANNFNGMPHELLKIDQLKIPIIARCGDPNDAKKSFQLHKKWNISYYFHFIPKKFFHEMGYPHNFKFKSIMYGVEPSLFENIIPFKNRIKNRILNSGNTGNLKPISRVINKIKNPKWNNLSCYYLRTMCNKLPYVDYTKTLQHEYVNDKYTLLLQKYAASIAASTYYPLIKYWENAASGCLTFMEITKRNHGDFIGFNDEENAIFINNNNYKEKFQTFLDDPNNIKWEKIANSGRDFALKNFSNDVGVNSLVTLMKSLLI